MMTHSQAALQIMLVQDDMTWMKNSIYFHRIQSFDMYVPWSFFFSNYVRSKIGEIFQKAKSSRIYTRKLSNSKKIPILC
jgi:hypothetical protein